MTLAAAVQERLKARVPALRTVGGALDLAAMQRANALPPQGPAAMVAPRGLRGGQVRSMAGGFVQDRDELVLVILILRDTDAARDRQGDLVSDLVEAVQLALAGWAPEGFTGDLRLVSGESLASPPGSFAYGLTFAVTHQLRTFPT